jgi:hypothetical protein
MRWNALDKGGPSFDRCRPGAGDESAGDRGIRDREGAHDRPGVGLSRTGGWRRPCSLERLRVRHQGAMWRSTGPAGGTSFMRHPVPLWSCRD